MLRCRDKSKADLTSKPHCAVRPYHRHQSREFECMPTTYPLSLCKKRRKGFALGGRCNAEQINVALPNFSWTVQVSSQMVEEVRTKCSPNHLQPTSVNDRDGVLHISHLSMADEDRSHLEVTQGRRKDARSRARRRRTVQPASVKP